MNVSQNDLRVAFTTHASVVMVTQSTSTKQIWASLHELFMWSVTNYQPSVSLDSPLVWVFLVFLKLNFSFFVRRELHKSLNNTRSASVPCFSHFLCQCKYSPAHIRKIPRHLWWSMCVCSSTHWAAIICNFFLVASEESHSPGVLHLINTACPLTSSLHIWANILRVDVHRTTQHQNSCSCNCFLIILF